MADRYEGYLLGKSAVTAEQFPRWGKTMDDFTEKLNRHFVRLGLQMLNESKRVQYVTRDDQTLRVKFVGSFVTLSAEELANALWECIPGNAVNWTGEFEGPRSYRLSVERMWRQVEMAAAFAVDTWKPNWEAENRRRARKGGSTSKRGASVPVEAVSARLSEVQHLPERRWASAIADLLTASGVKASARTVKRRLDELRSVDGSDAAIGTALEDEHAAPVQFDLVPAFADDPLGVLASAHVLGHEDLPLGLDGRVEEHDEFHEVTVPHTSDNSPRWIGPHTEADAKFFQRYEAQMDAARTQVVDELRDWLDAALAG